MARKRKWEAEIEAPEEAGGDTGESEEQQGYGQLLNFSELCRYLGRSPKTVRKMLIEGELPPKAFKKYWSKPQIDAFLKNKIPEPQTTAEEMADEILRKAAIHMMNR